MTVNFRFYGLIGEKGKLTKQSQGIHGFYPIYLNKTNLTQNPLDIKNVKFGYDQSFIFRKIVREMKIWKTNDAKFQPLA